MFYNTACNPLFLLKDRPVLIPASAITNSDALVNRESRLSRLSCAHKKRLCSRRSDGWKPWVVREVKKRGALELELSPSPLSRFHLSLEPQVAQAGLPVLEQATAKIICLFYPGLCFNIEFAKDFLEILWLLRKCVE